MKPFQLKKILSGFGEVKRLYCTPEKEENRQKRKKRGGPRQQQYVEAWVEFESKKVAKRTAKLLNGTEMGGNRRSAWYSYIWTMRYLKKFKWHDLVEEVRQRKKESEHKLQQQVAGAKREAAFYLENRQKRQKTGSFNGNHN